MENAHLDNLFARHAVLQQCRNDLEQAFQGLCQTIKDGSKILLCGNGGSAADCEHWSGEMLKGFEGDRPVTARTRKLLGADLADKLQGGLPMIPLTGFLSLSTAYANDCHSDYIFAQLTLALGKPGDALVALSTSGNSGNVLYAAKTANRLGMKVVGLTGADGGKLKDLCEVCIRVPAEKTYMIQELHLPVYHTLSLMLEEEFFPS